MLDFLTSAKDKGVEKYREQIGVKCSLYTILLSIKDSPRSFSKVPDELTQDVRNNNGAGILATQRINLNKNSTVKDKPGVTSLENADGV